MFAGVERAAAAFLVADAIRTSPQCTYLGLCLPRVQWSEILKPIFTIVMTPRTISGSIVYSRL